MIIGVPKEIQNHEGRVGLDPAHIRGLILYGLVEGGKVLVEKGAGRLSGFPDNWYELQGAEIVSQREVWEKSDMIIKVKEPMEQEYQLLLPGRTVMAFFHFAGNPILKEICDYKKIIAIPYEDLKVDGKSPILGAMSTIAGEISVDVGERYLGVGIEHGGRGMPLRDAVVAIIGCYGVAGTSARNMFMKRGIRRMFGVDRADVDTSECSRKFDYLSSSPKTIAFVLEQSDIVVGAVLMEKGAPKLITREMLKKMKPWSVFIDIGIDEGGISETSRPTSHDNPIFVEEGVIHYCVRNMPGIVPERSTPALINASFPFITEQIRKMTSA
ncbi:MAG: NAD(P)-dependent oxidoreductase [bacterium]|nr:NAD(P)-dependent oxidoreductase [bacterium]